MNLILGLAIGSPCTMGGTSLPPADFTVVISKTADGSVGQTYTATPSAADTYTYQWYRVSSGDISGATSSTYVAQSADIGYVLGCRVQKAGMSPVSATAIGWVQAAPTIIWNITSAEATTNTGGSTVTFTADASKTTATYQGTSGSAYLQRTATYTAVPADLGCLGLFIETDTQASFQNLSGITLYPAIGGTSYSSPSAVVTRTVTPNTTRGKLMHSVPAEQITTFGGLGSSNINFRAQIASSGGSSPPNAASPKLYAVARNVDTIPTYVMTWDDGRQSIYDWIAPQLQTRGLPSTFFVPPDNIGTAGFMSEANVIALPGMGMEVGVNGTRGDTSMTAAADWATLDAGFDYMWAWLAARNISTDARFTFPYPNGSTRVVGTITTIASVVATGTSTLTWVSGETIAAGLEVSGVNVPYDTIVDTGGTGTCTLKNRTTGDPVTVPAQTKQISFTNTSSPFYSGKLQDDLAAKGLRLGRGTNSGNFPSRMGFFNQGLVLPGNSMSSTGGNGTTALMNAVVDTAKSNRVSAIAYGHNAVDTIVSGLDTLKTELAAHFDYVAAERQAQRIQCLSMSQLWERDGGSSMPGLTF